MASELTDRQTEVLGTIAGMTKLVGPTVRELMAVLEIKSPHGVACHLDALEKKGAIERGRGAHNIRLLDASLLDGLEFQVGDETLQLVKVGNG